MSVNLSFARQVRLARLFSRPGGGALVVPLDHSVTEGPVTGGTRVNALVGELARNGVDAVVLHKGALRHVDADWFRDTSLVVHLSASTSRAPDPDAKYLVASVEEALRLGADAVSVHVNVGSAQEYQQVGDLARVSDACDRWNLPLIAMMYPRGPRTDDPHRADLIAHAATLAADLGADMVKTLYTGTVDEMADVTRSCPIPLIVAGGPRRTTADVLAFVADALRGGAVGVAMGRNVFESPNPGELVRRLAGLIHGTRIESGLRLPAVELTAAAMHRRNDQEDNDREAVLA